MKVLLAAGASAALHKACELASTLTQAGDEVRVVLTPRAAKLVSPQLFEALTGRAASVDEFSSERRGAMDHIDLAGWAERAVVAPATANVVARLALGLADDLLATTLLALPADVPRLVCPAMNVHMLDSPAIRRHLAQLGEDGWQVLEPGEGHLACGVEGRGRLAEVAQIVSAIAAL